MSASESKDSSDPRGLADEELIALAAEKDARAFEVLYDRHAGVAYSLAYRIVGDRGGAEDVAQEAFLSAWRAGARYDQARGSVRTWLLGIVRNRAIDVVRRGGKSAPKIDLDDHELLDRQPHEGEATDDAAIRSTVAAEVRQVVAGLPDDQAEVIKLAYFGGFTHAEISEVLGAPLGTVKGRMRLGLAKMRSVLAEASG